MYKINSILLFLLIFCNHGFADSYYFKQCKINENAFGNYIIDFENGEIKVLEKKDKFYKFDNLWIKKKDLKKINFSSRNIFNNAIKFINVKYKWGGKYYNGIDCSALVQLCLNNNQKFCPRDTKDQIKFFKNKISLKNLRKNDLIFWKGHVAIVISKTKLIHAYGPLKRVIIAPIKKTIDKIYKKANLKLIGARRLR